MSYLNLPKLGPCELDYGPVGTEANLGMDRLFNAMGYFVEFGNDSDEPAFLLGSTQRWRWRLKPSAKGQNLASK